MLHIILLDLKLSNHVYMHSIDTILYNLFNLICLIWNLCLNILFLFISESNLMKVLLISAWYDTTDFIFSGNVFNFRCRLFKFRLLLWNTRLWLDYTLIQMKKLHWSNCICFYCSILIIESFLTSSLIIIVGDLV